MATELDEILSDVGAYFSVGDTDNAVSILFEAARDYPAPQDDLAIVSFMYGYCRSLWEAHRIDEARLLSNAVLVEALSQTGKAVESDFLDLYTTALAETGSSPLPVKRLFRHRNLLRVFARVNDLETGDVVECGCARGLSALQLALSYSQRRPGWQGEGLHVFDSFAGLSEPGAEDATDLTNADPFLTANMQRGRFAVPLELVSRNLQTRFPRIELHAGWIPAVFSGEAERRYRFVHIDVDLYQPTNDSLAYFFPRLVEGGIVVTDDYNWPGAKTAFDKFARKNSIQLNTTETDQAYFVKGGLK